MRFPPIAAAAVLLLALAAAPAAHSRPSDCAAKKTATLAASKEARIYEDREGWSYSCSYRTGKRKRIGASFECGGVGRTFNFRFGGRLVGFVVHRCGIDTGRHWLRVIDVRTGRTKLEAMTPIDSDYTDVVSSTEIANWAMRPNGSFVWIGRRYPFDDGTVPVPPDQFQVWKLEVATPRSPQKLDEGGDIDPKSLALGTRGTPAPVYWRKGGAIFSSTLR